MKSNSNGGVPSRQPHKLGPELDFATAEAYKLLRTNISFSIPNKATGRIIGLTSPRPQDGKSFSSVNLAYSLAEAGHQVVLIDGDMRRSSLAETLKKPMAPGLSNYLVGDVKDVIHKNVLHENLSLITAGDPPPNPAELIGSPRMNMVLEALSQRYDYIIIDLPPVNLVSDPLVLSKYLDGVVVVLRHGRSKQSDVKDAVRQLKFVGAHILGFVYNGYDKGSKLFYRRRSYYDSSYKYYTNGK
jgi:capsular exopolysaccharide synthesis family protein